MIRIILFFSLALCLINSIADVGANQNPESISTSALQNFNSNPDKVKQIITLLLKLASENLTYQYGSADPKMGGMDCSGTIYYLLNSMGLKDAPRSSHLIYKWVWEKGQFYSVNGNKIDSFEFSHLHPGDLLFWSGTYAVAHDPNVTHVMLYIGKNTAGQLLMAGASNGRTFKGRKIWGVSVFDFLMPNPESTSRFLGYSCTPGINCQRN